jgi:large subunit ribosomal protein L30
MPKQLKITLVRSLNGRLESHKACARGLGLRRISSSVVVNDTPENRGMITKIQYLLKIDNA